MTSETADGDLFVVVAGENSGVALDEIGPAIATSLGGRGGGRGSVYQGKTASLAGREKALELLRGS